MLNLTSYQGKTYWVCAFVYELLVYQQIRISSAFFYKMKYINTKMI